MLRVRPSIAVSAICCHAAAVMSPAIYCCVRNLLPLCCVQPSRGNCCASSRAQAAAACPPICCWKPSRDLVPWPPICCSKAQAPTRPEFLPYVFWILKLSWCIGIYVLNWPVFINPNWFNLTRIQYDPFLIRTDSTRIQPDFWPDSNIYRIGSDRVVSSGCMFGLYSDQCLHNSNNPKPDRVDPNPTRIRFCPPLITVTISIITSLAAITPS